MYRIERHGIVWSLEDEKWSSIAQDLVLPSDQRRPHLVLPHPLGFLFVKFFREEGFIPFFRNLFFPRGQREYRLGRKLLALSLPTPLPVAYGIGRGFSCSIQMWINGKDFFTKMLAAEGREECLNKVASLLRRMKAAKVRHNDLHGGNILFGPSETYIIDLHSVRLKRVFRCADEVSNLCHVLHGHYGNLKEGEKTIFFDAYGNPEIRGKVEDELDRFALRWVERKKRRAFRTTSKLNSTKNIVYVKDRERAATGEAIGLLKKDKKTVVERHSDHVRKIYARPGRLRRAWQNHVVLLYMGLPIVPEPFHVQKPSIKERGFIAMEDLTGKGEEVDTFLDRHYDRLDYTSRMQFLKKFSSFLQSLIKANIGHRDMKACNFFFLNDGSFRILDVEDIIFAKSGPPSALRMFLQLNMSIPRRVSIADRLRFFSRLTKGASFDRKELLRAIAKESRGAQIQYVGVKGTVFECWDHPTRPEKGPDISQDCPSP